jgi:hypothetical protein
MAAQDAYECDVLVIGSGASGMSAAVSAAAHGLKVLIIEKEPKFGGTTARSGGWLWIPGTSLAKEWGINESPDLARTYLRHEAGNSFDSARVDAFIEHGPKAVDFFTNKTAVRFDMPMVFPDYHAEAPGGTQGGRSMVARPFDGRELGDHIKTLGAALPELTVFGMMLGSGKEIVHFMRATKSLQSAVYVTKRLSKHFLQVLRYGRGTLLTNGNALAGRLPSRPSISASPCGFPRRRKNWLLRMALFAAPSSKRMASACASLRARAWCWLAVDSRTMWRGARISFRTRPPARNIIRPVRPAIRAMACGSPRRLAARWTLPCLTPRRGFRSRSRRARTGHAA